jgi:hypothetical protein
MRERRLRAGAGALVGVLALDDVFELLAEEAEAIGDLVRAQAPR